MNKITFSTEKDVADLHEITVNLASRYGRGDYDERKVALAQGRLDMLVSSPREWGCSRSGCFKELSLPDLSGRLQSF